MKKKIYQLGLEAHLGAQVMMAWMEGKFDCDLRIRKARTPGLIVVELTDGNLVETIKKITDCRITIKEV